MVVDGIILSGGQSSRMGQDKSLLLRDHRDMFFYMLEQMEALDLQDIYISRNPNQVSYLTRHPIVADKYRTKGPLGGLHACMQRSTAEAVLVVPIDLPLIEISDLDHLLQSGLMNKSTTYFQNHYLPLFLPNSSAVRAYLDEVMREAQANQSVRALCQHFSAQAIEAFNKQRLHNANTWQQWQNAKHVIAQF